MGCPSVPAVTYTAFSSLIHRKAREKNIPVFGALELTQRCNMRCPFCYCRPDTERAEMSFDRMRNVMDEIADAGCLWLLLTGGEPLLRADFVEIFQYAKQKGFIITLFTNGTLITDKIADLFRDYRPFSIEISLYGATAKTHEAMTEARGSFKSCMNGIDIILKRNLPLKLKTTVTTLNKHELQQIKAFAAGLGVGFRFDAMLQPGIDGSCKHSGLRLSPSEVAQLDSSDKERSDGWHEVYDEFVDNDIAEDLFVCEAGRSSFHLDPYGTIRACDMVRTPCFSLSDGTFQFGWEYICGQIGF